MVGVIVYFYHWIEPKNKVNPFSCLFNADPYVNNVPQFIIFVKAFYCFNGTCIFIQVKYLPYIALITVDCDVLYNIRVLLALKVHKSYMMLE